MTQHSRATYDARHNEIYPARVGLLDRMRDEEKICERCAHWAYARNAPVNARVNGALVAVAQCRLAGDDDNAPYAETAGADAAIFTQADSRCPAFTLHPDVVYDDAFVDRDHQCACVG